MTTQAVDSHASHTQSTAASKTPRRAGWTMGILAVLFLLFDGVAKVVRLDPSVQGTVELGYTDGAVVTIGIILLVCTAVYVVPRTAVLGAILLTGYLGGAVATHFRLGNPLFSHTLFPVYVAVLVWGALYLLDERVRALVPLRVLHGFRA